MLVAVALKAVALKAAEVMAGEMEEEEAQAVAKVAGVVTEPRLKKD